MALSQAFALISQHQPIESETPIIINQLSHISHEFKVYKVKESYICPLCYNVYTNIYILKKHLGQIHDEYELERVKEEYFLKKKV